MDKQTIIDRHAKVTQFLKALEKPHDDSWKGGYVSSKNNEPHKFKWYGDVDLDGAKNLALYGWEKGLTEIDEQLASVAKTCEGRVVMKDIAGSHPDVARFVAGMPDCMNRRVISDAARKPCLDIVVNCSYGSAISSKEIINYGAAIASHIDELENSGYSISIEAGAVTRNNKNVAAGPVVNLKQHGEMMDMGRFVYFIAHPSFLRRLVFAHWEGRNTYSELRDGYGSICDLPKDEQGDIYFGRHGDLAKCRTMEGAMAYVRSLINAQMPELFTGGQRAA